MTELEPAQDVICRTFPVELTPGEGRTVDVCIVPYGERITHNDGLGGVPKGQPYTEEWMAGAFTHQLKAANRVLANVEHEPGIAGVVGHGIALRETPDGLYGSFKIHDTPEGNKALMLVNEGVFGGVSLEAVPQKTIRGVSGVIQRVKAHLRNIALCREPAYHQAVVMAVREAPVIPDKLQPVEMDPELLERCQKLGVSLPERYQAHLAPTDTPAETGTPDEATPAETQN